MNAISTFTFHQDHNVRVQMINGEPYFCLPDVCSVLSVDRTSRLLRDLDEKGLADCHTLTSGGNQRIKYVNEPNLYRVIFRSNKPEARQFQDWVFNEVLPSIRKTGKYQVPTQQEKPKPEYLTGNDMNNLKHLVWLCSTLTVKETAMSNAIWYCFRQSTNTPSPEQFKVADLPKLAKEFEWIFNILKKYRKICIEKEREMIKSLLKAKNADDHFFMDLMNSFDVPDLEFNTQIDQKFKLNFHAKKLIERKS